MWHITLSTDNRKWDPGASLGCRALMFPLWNGSIGKRAKPCGTLFLPLCAWVWWLCRAILETILQPHTLWHHPECIVSPFVSSFFDQVGSSTATCTPMSGLPVFCLPKPVTSRYLTRSAKKFYPSLCLSLCLWSCSARTPSGANRTLSLRSFLKLFQAHFLPVHFPNCTCDPGTVPRGEGAHPK